MNLCENRIVLTAHTFQTIVYFSPLNQPVFTQYVQIYSVSP